MILKNLLEKNLYKLWKVNNPSTHPDGLSNRSHPSVRGCPNGRGRDSKGTFGEN